MQTFLPKQSYVESMACLDNVRLGNQVYREGKTLLDGKWPNHPACKMWVGHEHSLAMYCYRGAQEMRRRYYWKPEVVERWLDYFQVRMDNLSDTGRPSWMGREDIHASHRSNLLRKDALYYSKFGWDEPDNLPYVWPI